jgi:hypothetical protein
MTLAEKLWWAECIKANRYRYNFGRQANRSLTDLELPARIPDWVSKVDLQANRHQQMQPPESLDTSGWRAFRLDDLFRLERGRHVLKRDMRDGPTAYVSATSNNNGISAWINVPPDYPGGLITVSNNGSVGEAFYQPSPFIASGDVTVLKPQTPLSEAAALFVCSLIYAEKFRWNYGRKWVLGRMRESTIRLPIDPSGRPDWTLAERYIRSLPLSDAVL